MPQAANHGLVLDPEALYVALDTRRRQLQRESRTAISWRKVAAQAGVAPSAFSRLGILHGNLHANVLIKMLAWLGTTDLAPFVRDVPPPEKDQKRNTTHEHTP